MKKLFGLLMIVAIVTLVWFAFALWSGIYSIYTYPPSSNEYPDGATLIVSRDEWEPMYNSPDYKPPKREPTSSGTFGFEKANVQRRPIDTRIVVRLPYIKWAYTKSLEPQEP